jgi:hypothetical protein
LQPHRIKRPRPRGPWRPPADLSPTKHRLRCDSPAPPPPAWPSFTGQAQYVGTTPDGRLVVYVDPLLGVQGLKNAQDLCADGPRVLSFNDTQFGITGGPVAVIIYAIGGVTDGTGGADHNGCDFRTGAAIEVCASFGSSQRCSALFEAELSECAMNGQLCGLSTGEALSRRAAMDVSGNALSDFATAPTWDADGRPNFVDQVYMGTIDVPGDQNPDANGCGMAFLSWMIAQGFCLAELAQTMVQLGDGGTLAQLYGALTGADPATAWPSFTQALDALGGAVTSDDPFAAGLPSPAPSHPPPEPPPPPAPSPGVTLDQATAWATSLLGDSELDNDAKQLVAQGLEDNWPE